jgi:hypothetical protein
MNAAEYLALIFALGFVLAAMALRLLIHSVRYEWQLCQERRSEK